MNESINQSIQNVALSITITMESISRESKIKIFFFLKGSSSQQTSSSGTGGVTGGGTGGGTHQTGSRTFIIYLLVSVSVLK